MKEPFDIPVEKIRLESTLNLERIIATISLIKPTSSTPRIFAGGQQTGPAANDVK